VISRQTSNSLKGQPIDVAALGAEFQVRYVLEGSMRMNGDKLRVNVELVDPATRLSVWSGRIERDQAERQAVQDEIGPARPRAAVRALSDRKRAPLQ
jgi:TolB-like protein